MMRLYWVIALVICLVGNGATALAPSLRVASQSRIANKAAVTRSLKSGNNNAMHDDGERSWLSPIAGALSKVSPSAQGLANKLWLKSETNPEKVFKILRLGQTDVKLDDNPRFIQWLKYVDMYSNLKYRSYSNNQVFDLLRKSKSDQELVALFLSLRQVSGMKGLADQMQRFLFLSSSSASHRLLNEAWLKARETPKEVFNILRLDEAKGESTSMFLQWFKYTELYRSAFGDEAFSTLKTYQFMIDTFPMKLNSEFATLFQLAKQTPDLTKFGEEMQKLLFTSWLKRKFTPRTVQDQLKDPWNTAVLELPKNHALYGALEDYTIFYTANRRGEGVLKTVRGLFANHKPYEAIAVAMKA